MAAHFTGNLFSQEKDSTRLIAVMHYVDGITFKEPAAHSGLSVIDKEVMHIWITIHQKLYGGRVS